MTPEERSQAEVDGTLCKVQQVIKDQDRGLDGKWGYGDSAEIGA
jgi:hypothetical protein